MTDRYRDEVLIDAPASVVYEALTTQNGVGGWWTTSCEVGIAQGQAIRVQFGRSFKVMRIQTLQADAEVGWLVTDAFLDVPGLTKTTEWIGTTIIFHLEQESDSVTRLRLEHIGLTPDIECHEICVHGWAQFLDSLKRYTETGEGSPYIDNPT